MTPIQPIQLVQQRAFERSADFIEKHAAGALLFGRKVHLHNYVATLIKGDGLAIECGVWKGGSINRMAGLLPERTFHGFDSFAGLSEDWSGNFQAQGHFDQGGNMPEVKENVRLIPGWIGDTLEPFLAENEGPIDYLHIDTDTYSPAKTALSLARPRLVEGSIILFDELYGYPAWEHHEYRALTETLPEDCYEFVGFSQMSAALRIKTAPGAA